MSISGPFSPYKISHDKVFNDQQKPEQKEKPLIALIKKVANAVKDFFVDLFTPGERTSYAAGFFGAPGGYFFEASGGYFVGPKVVVNLNEPNI